MMPWSYPFLMEEILVFAGEPCRIYSCLRITNLGQLAMSSCHFTELNCRFMIQMCRILLVSTVQSRKEEKEKENLHTHAEHVGEIAHEIQRCREA
jgi:hypothetical protein